MKPTMERNNQALATPSIRELLDARTRYSRGFADLTRRVVSPQPIPKTNPLKSDDTARGSAISIEQSHLQSFLQQSKKSSI